MDFPCLKSQHQEPIEHDLCRQVLFQSPIPEFQDVRFSCMASWHGWLIRAKTEKSPVTVRIRHSKAWMNKWKEEKIKKKEKKKTHREGAQGAQAQGSSRMIWPLKSCTLRKGTKMSGSYFKRLYYYYCVVPYSYHNLLHEEGKS